MSLIAKMNRLSATLLLVCLLGIEVRADKGGSVPQNIPFTAIEAIVPHSLKETFVFKTPQEWNQQWNTWWNEENYCPRVYGGGRPPEVDFEKEELIVATAGQFSHGGYVFNISKVVEADGIINVVIDETEPGPRCITTASFECPSSVITIPRSNKPVAFTFQKSVVNCK